MLDKRNIIKLFVTCILIMIFTGCYCETSKADYSENLKKLENIRSSVVEIYVGFNDKEFHMIKHVCGTVVQNDENAYILTLYKETSVSNDELKKYCTDNKLKINKNDIGVYAVADNRYIKLSLEDSDENTDIALYKSEKNIDSKLVITMEDSATVSKDTKVFSIGFPAKMKENTDKDFGDKNTIIYEGKLAKDYNAVADATMTYNSLVDSGTLGCPITDINGKVVGVNSSLSRGQEVLEYTVVSSYKIKQFLDKNKITYTGRKVTEKVVKKKPENKLYKTGKIYSLPITAIIVIVLLVLMLVTRSREE